MARPYSHRPMVRNLCAFVCLLYSVINFAQEVIGQTSYAQFAPGFEDGASPYLEMVYGKRLLIDVQPVPNGLLVIRIHLNSPTLQMVSVNNPAAVFELQEGDTILAINGRATHALADLVDGLARSGDDCELEILDQNTGSSSLLTVKIVQDAFPRMNAPAAPANVRENKLWMIVAGLTNDPQIGKAIDFSMLGIVNVFEGMIEESRREIILLRGEDCTADRLAQTILGLPTSFDDTVLVYYLGHGAYDNRFAQGDLYEGHFFDIPTGDVLRKTIWKHLEAVPARARMLISDTCNVEDAFDTEPKPMAPYTARQVPIQGPTQMEWLFLGHSGRLDIGAASRNQYAWYSLETGGWFSSSFLKTLGKHDMWSPLAADLIPQTQNLFEMKREEYLSQPGSTPLATLQRLRAQNQLTPIVRQRLRRDAEPPISMNITRTFILPNEFSN